MAENVAAFTGAIPEAYERGLGPVMFVDYADATARAAAAVTRDDAAVLEIAAGTGIVTRRLRDLLPMSAKLVATDLNQAMLDVAQPKFRAGEQVAFQTADALALPFGDASFDVVVCQFGVMFFPDKDQGYREAHRVLRPGGRYLFSVWDTHGHNPFGRIAHALVAELFPQDPPQFYTVPFGYAALDPIRAALDRAGFVDARFSVLHRVKAVNDLAAWAHGLVHGNPLADQIKARGGDPAAVVAALHKAMVREFGATTPARVPMQAILIEAVRP